MSQPSDPKSINTHGKDDCKKVSILSFIHLFITRRILHEYIHDSYDKRSIKETKYAHKINVLNALTSELNNTQDQNEARRILSILINNGIKKYMTSMFNEITQRVIIEKIFNKIILSKFTQKYHDLHMIKFSQPNIDKTYKYQSMVFNAADLMCSIFQFLLYEYIDWKDSKQDLSKCSLVCSQWLYHAWNPNSIYHVDITKLTQEYDAYVSLLRIVDSNPRKAFNLQYSKGQNRIRRNNAYIQSWQRICRARSVAYCETERLSINCTHSRDSELCKPSQLLSTKLLMFSNIEKLHCIEYTEQQIQILNVLLQKCCDKIKYFYVAGNAYKRKTIPLKLINVHAIYIYTKYVPIIWSQKCRYLELKILDCSKYFDFVINNCDCSGIKRLHLIEDKNTSFSSKLNHNVLSKFAQKFTNITKLRVCFLSANVTLIELLCQLQQIIRNNHGYLELDIGEVHANAANCILKYLRQRNVMFINKFKATSKTNIHQFQSQLDMLDMRNIEYFQIKKPLKWPRKYDNDFMLIPLTQKLSETFFGQWNNDLYWPTYFNINMNELSFVSLKVIDIEYKLSHFAMGFINEFLALILQIVEERRVQLCVKAHFVVTYDTVYTLCDSMFLWQLEIFNKNVLALIDISGVMIDIELKVTDLYYLSKIEVWGKYLSVWNTYHQNNCDVLNKHRYKQSQTCKYYHSYQKPIVSCQRIVDHVFRAVNCAIIDEWR